jgi:WD40 repeat protein
MPRNQSSAWRMGMPSVLLLVLLPVFLVIYCFTPPQPYASLPVPEGRGLMLFSSDGGTLVTSAEGEFGHRVGPLRVWDVRAGVERFTVAADWKAIETVAFSPDGRLFAAHEHMGLLRVWRSDTGQEVAALRPEPQTGQWLHFRFSPDGQCIIFQEPGLARGRDLLTFWDVERRQERGSIRGPLDTLVFTPDGQRAATFTRQVGGPATRLLLWTTAAPLPPSLIQQRAILVDNVVFAPDLETYATCNRWPNGNGEITLWNLPTGTRLWSRSFAELGISVQMLSFQAQGRILTASGPVGTASGWQCNPMRINWRTILWDGSQGTRHTGSFVQTPTLSPDGAWLAERLPDGVRLSDCSGTHTADLTTDGDQSASSYRPFCTFSPDSSLLVAQDMSRQAQEPYLAQWLPAHLNPFEGEPGCPIARLWEVNTGRHQMAFPKCCKAVFSPDGKVLATVQSTGINLWQLPIRKPIWEWLAWLVVVWLLAVGIARWLKGCRSAPTSGPLTSVF